MAKARTELVHCDNCGEDYAATYRRCPFCGAKAGQRFDDYDEADYDDYEDGSRRGGKRLAGGGGDPAKIALCVLAALVMLAVICILLSVVIPKLVTAPAAPSASTEPSASPSEEVSIQPSEEPTQPANVDDPDSSFHPLPVIEGMDPDDPLSLDSPDLPPVESDPISSAAPASPTPSQAPASQAPVSSGGAKLTYAGKAISEFSITAQYPDPITLKVQGGTAASWRSLNTNVATVSEGGKVSGVGNGSTKIECTLSDGSVLRCDVRVSGISGQGGGQTPSSQPPATNSNASLTYGGRAISEFSITAQYPDPITLKVQGGTAQSWKSLNTNVASVTEGGKVSGVGNGTTKIQCTLTDGTVLTCEVRVSGK